jgi:hypothetical protein
MEDGRILSEEYTKPAKAKRSWFDSDLSAPPVREPAMASAGEIDDRHAFRVMVRSGQNDLIPTALHHRPLG